MPRPTLLLVAAPTASAAEGWHEIEGYTSYQACQDAGASLQRNDPTVDQWYCATYPDTHSWYDLEYHTTS
ncbi:hypothetical protein [Kitasatospora sp. NPDC101183]|uniref:hypothetical protein n=1 Tax=Kitasatospora sp. NPDC101183 TaxID=3364100 RepID=UPI0038229B04